MCCLPLLSPPSCSACSFEHGHPPTPMVRSAVVPNPQQFKSNFIKGNFKNENQCFTRLSESSISQLISVCSIAKDHSGLQQSQLFIFSSNCFFLLRNLLPSFAFFSARLLVSHSDSHLTRLLWHLATESRNASCYPRDQFPSITPSSLTESNEAERSSVAATAQALTRLSASRSAAARHPSHY